MSRNNSMSRGLKVGATASGHNYSAFHNALLSKCYPKSQRSSTSGAPVIINGKNGRQTVGFIQDIDGVKTFVKYVVTAKHLFRNYDAWGIDRAVLLMLAAKQVSAICIIADKSAVYQTTVSEYQFHGIPVDYGFDKQVLLPRRYFTVVGGAF